MDKVQTKMIMSINFSHTLCSPFLLPMMI